MALYFYRNLLTNALVYSDQPAPPEGNRNMELIGEQTNMNPTVSSSWAFDDMRSTFASVEKDDRVSGKISGLTSMTSMFESCSSLTIIDLSGFDTSQVTSMSRMFNSCSSLAIIDLSGFGTSKVTAMDSMFNICSSLASLDLSSFDTSKVTSMSSMFIGRSSLRLLAISGSMSNALSQLPASQYYPASGGSSVAKADLTAGTWVRDEADLSKIATMVEQAQAFAALRRDAGRLEKRIAALEKAAG